MIQSSPFLPMLPPIARGDIGRVVFPGTTRAGRGLLSLADRIPENPQNTTHVEPPNTYTRPAHMLRVGGLYEPRTVGRDSAAFSGRPA